MPYARDSVPLNQLHSQTHSHPSIDGNPLPDFTHTAFIGMVDGIRMAKNGSAVLTITVEPDYVSDVLPLWTANSIISVNVAPWDPEIEDEWDDVG